MTNTDQKLDENKYRRWDALRIYVDCDHQGQGGVEGHYCSACEKEIKKALAKVVAK